MLQLYTQYIIYIDVFLKNITIMFILFKHVYFLAISNTTV
jgi:hypothetical protein